MTASLSAPRLMFSSSPAGVTLEPGEIPVLKPHQVLVRNSCTQVSAGSESNFLRHGPQSYGLPADMQCANIGYMAVGRVTAVGSRVEGFRVGDRVTASAPHAQHVAVDAGPSSSLELVPEGVADECAGFVALGDVALHSVRRAAVQIDQSVAVFGMGMVGQMVLQFARIAGAYPLIAIDLEDERLEMAKQSGATHFINAARENVIERVRAITRGAGAEAVFHCAQAAAILQTAMECAADRGAVVLTGSPPGTATIRLKEELLRKELVVTGTYEAGLMEPHAYWRWSRSRNRRACLRLMATGELRLDHLLTHVVPIAQAPSIYQMVLQGSKGWLGIAFKWD